MIRSVQLTSIFAAKTVIQRPSTTNMMIGMMSQPTIMLNRSYSTNDTVIREEAQKIKAKIDIKKLVAEKERKMRVREEQREKTRALKQKEAEKKALEKQKQKLAQEKLKNFKKLQDEKARERKKKQVLADLKKKQMEKLKEKLKLQREKEASKGMRKKDPNRPKKAISARFWFFSDQYNKVKSTMTANGQPTDLASVSQELRRQFDELSEEARAKYNLLEQNDRQRYQRERAAYDQKKLETKRPLTAYNAFFKDQFPKVAAENPQLKFVEITKLLAEKWNSADESTKQGYKTH